MEFRGTRGKWKADTYTSENGREITFVCNTEYNSERTDIHVRFSAIEETEKETNRANALLISKSPELLEMLKKVRFYAEFDSMRLDLYNEIEQLIKEATEL
jgi:1,4-dihydroxy-2-naphthoyl-CoA synthase